MAKQKSMTREEAAYQQRVEARMPRSQTLRQCLQAFLSGGAICCIGQMIRDFGQYRLLLEEDACAAFTAIVLVFLGALFTGFGVYDKLGAWAGAGSVVPITGFANSIVAPAMEFKREGMVLGVGAKLFTIAGPVLVFGVGASVLVGLLTCLVTG